MARRYSSMPGVGRVHLDAISWLLAQERLHRYPLIRIGEWLAKCNKMPLEARPVL